jgi:curved DNA-binding protein CbpA
LKDGLSFYDVLHVSPKASDEEVKLAYRRLAKTHHPDTNPQNRRMAELKLKALNEAYSELKTQEKRTAYNRALRGENDNRNRPSFFSQLFSRPTPKKAGA